MSNRLPTFYLSHGSGPWPYLTGAIRESLANLEAFLKELPRQLSVKPKAILVVSAHWEEWDFGVMANPSPQMVYDFVGFPAYLRQIQYPAPGSPMLARRAHALIEEAGLATHLDLLRGFDHGTYSLLAIMYPEADTPVIQVSIRADYDPKAHLKLGRALAPLRSEGVLIIGSGMSNHNLDRSWGSNRRTAEQSVQFDAWLKETLVDSAPLQRSERLIEWEHAPFARFAHPQEDHLMPLLVAVGSAEEEPGQVIHQEENFFDRLTISSYRFGNT